LVKSKLTLCRRDAKLTFSSISHFCIPFVKIFSVVVAAAAAFA
jgi:hypothetical protein